MRATATPSGVPPEIENGTEIDAHALLEVIAGGAAGTLGAAGGFAGTVAFVAAGGFGAPCAESGANSPLTGRRAAAAAAASSSFQCSTALVCRTFLSSGVEILYVTSQYLSMVLSTGSELPKA